MLFVFHPSDSAQEIDFPTIIRNTSPTPIVLEDFIRRDRLLSKIPNNRQEVFSFSLFEGVDLVIS